KFDSSPLEETVIEKVTARFFINQEFTCTRKQFPLILAYGITCHKSQGLSLDVVLADLGGDVFEPGMAYVSLSRVRRLQNLYLFDFDAAQICCNALAYNEYQRLRPLSFPSPLPLLSKCNVWPLSGRPRQGSLLSRAHHSAVSVSITANDRRRSKAPKKRALPVQQQAKNDGRAAKKPRLTTVNSASSRSEQPSLPIVRLSNTSRFNCYSNTVVQLLRHLPHFNAALSNLPPSELCGVLLETMMGLHPDTTLLRQTVGGDFAIPQMHDACEFLLHLLNALDSFDIEEQFAFVERPVQRCTQCEDHPLRDVQPIRELILHLLPSQYHQETFQTVVNRVQSAEVKDMPCSLPDGSTVQHRHSNHLEINFQPAQKYLIMQLNKFHLNRGEMVKRDMMVTKFSQSSQMMFGHRFRAIGAVEHLGHSPLIAHYIAWCRSDNGWFRYDDDKAPQQRARLPNGLRNIVTLVLEKL
uniref:USP domain-containing protein n=1 Tax=Plectus sambesii TaxID=2011161 RepID=A0A914WX55_9BILA